LDGTKHFTAANNMAGTQIEKIAFMGWPNCYRIFNGETELIVTSDIGPRILRYGFIGGQNFFWIQEEAAGKSGEKEWMMRGGHRIWLGPEDVRYTYPPDNEPVKIEINGAALTATQPVEKETGVEKQITVRLAASGTGVEVTHRLTNRFNMALEFCPWALTMMAPGGVGVTMFPPKGTHPENLEAANPLVMWRFTDLSDPRWKFTRKYMMLRQDSNNRVPQKLGHFNIKTVAGYALGAELFIKRYDADPSKTYADLGCSFETFTNERFLELETLGPLTKVPAGGFVEHVERWTLHRGVKLEAFTDEELDRMLLPLL